MKRNTDTTVPTPSRKKPYDFRDQFESIATKRAELRAKGIRPSAMSILSTNGGTRDADL